jgi:hypothetical protein
MKKAIAAVLAVAALLLTGCNKQIIDLTLKFDRAIIELPGGKVVEGKVQTWRDYEDGDQIQVKINGVTYLVHSSDVVLISEGG